MSSIQYHSICGWAKEIVTPDKLQMFECHTVHPRHSAVAKESKSQYVATAMIVFSVSTEAGKGRCLSDEGTEAGEGQMISDTGITGNEQQETYGCMVRSGQRTTQYQTIA